ncbi:MAG: hypothetical protein J5848_02865 [Bacteroidales bacterium]|nr:hypothetical protein [Bacteroidales bacterium]
MKQGYTIGYWIVDGKLMCNTLEDEVRDLNKNGKFDNGEKKIYGESAIPYGKYKIKMTYSPKYKRMMPQVMDVPHFTGIRIHAANKPTELEGCIALGENKVKGGIINSRLHVNVFIDMLVKAGGEADFEII